MILVIHHVVGSGRALEIGNVSITLEVTFGDGGEHL